MKQIQKALHEMNVLLHQAVSDITGRTGMAILEAIVQGERDPVRLARLRDPRVKFSQEQIAKALRGDFREELVAVVGSALRHLRFVQSEIANLDDEIGRRVGRLQPRTTAIAEDELVANEVKRSARHHAPEFGAVRRVQKLYGVPLGEFYRRMRARKGTRHAIVATARKLAEIFYTMVTTAKPYRSLDTAEYNRKLRDMQIRNLRRRAARLGFELKETEPPQPAAKQPSPEDSAA